MSNQLKRVIDTKQMSDEEKRRIVRQVFDQMMEERVDFSMNNVRLAVKTVSSSYRLAAEKQRKKGPAKTETKATEVAQPEGNSSEIDTGTDRSTQRAKSTGRLDIKSFGRRASSGPTDTGRPSSKSLPVIETALKLTGNGRASGQASPSSGGGRRLDAAGNPIVVVLLPQERRKKAAAA